ncbi:Hypothetical predicted protein [Olea europaea subsp. europaea]|uniref:Uncharacterized protein n=1 Tax=Olea europaea subsp. europaea TaxID=158383 RepID=A0A8S0T5Y9_OLEEU|nr:Hypothetical predicted protein [Olea europaea subsp. europaea]
MEVICWVFREYGTANGKYSASYISGKLSDVAEAHSTDDIVKEYAVTALEKIYSFEIAVGRKVNMLPECAYELQAINGLDAHSVANIMPIDASCEDIELVLASFTELVPVPDQYYHTEVHYSATPVPSFSNAGSSELKLRFYGVQKKWGKPSYSSPVSSTSINDTTKIKNGTTQRNSVGSANSKARDAFYDSRKQLVEISPEKHKLAASHFGGASKSDRIQSSSSQKVTKNNSHAVDKSHAEKTATSDTFYKNFPATSRLARLSQASIIKSGGIACASAVLKDDVGNDNDYNVPSDGINELSKDCSSISQSTALSRWKLRVRAPVILDGSNKDWMVMMRN